MNETKVNTVRGKKSLADTKNLQIDEAAPLPPFRFDGGNLGLNLGSSEKPSIYIVDSIGQRWLFQSVEFVLKNIDSFLSRRDYLSLLSSAAVHYGFDDACVFINGRAA
jgi:hypothetical protein